MLRPNNTFEQAAEICYEKGFQLPKNLKLLTDLFNLFPNQPFSKNYWMNYKRSGNKYHFEVTARDEYFPVEWMNSTPDPNLQRTRCFLLDSEGRGYDTECFIHENVYVICENDTLVEWAECDSPVKELTGFN